MKYLIKIAILLITLFWQLASQAQTNAVASLDTNAILIGDQLNLELSFTCPSDFTVEWPKLNDTIITEIEILEKSKIDVQEFKRKHEMFLPFALLAVGLLIIEILLRYLYFRKLP